jgi:hypothetical protein
MDDVESGLRNIGVKNGSEQFEENTLHTRREGNQDNFKY